jgi:nitroreductase
MEKPAPAEYPILDVISRRWSPRVFTPKAPDSATVRTLLEAARWAPSSNNEQPWRFMVATRDDEKSFATMLDVLVPQNQVWAKDAGVLMIAFASLSFARNGKPNRHALHDTGLATENLMLQATALGLQAHPMAGFDVEKVKTTYAMPEGFEPIAALAVGVPGDPNTLPEDRRERELAPRVRKPQHEFVFSGTWGNALK